MTIWKNKIDGEELEIVTCDHDDAKNFNPPGKSTDPTNIVGIGFKTKRDGTWLRAAVQMRRNHSLAELREAVSLLFEAFINPESGNVKVVRGSVELTPNTMQTKALCEYMKASAL